MKKKKFLFRRKLVKTSTIIMALLIAATLISSSAVSVTIGNEQETVNKHLEEEIITIDTADKGYAPESRPTTEVDLQIEGVIGALGRDTFYAVDATNANFVWFDHTTPGTFNTIAATGITEFPQGACFVGDTWWVCDTVGNIWTVDEVTGVKTVVGNAGTGDLTGLAYDPSSGVLYGCDLVNLYTIDQGTGLATLIGPLGTGGWFISLDCDNSGNMYGIDLGVDNFYSIDTSTGAATLIGSLGININFGQDLSYDKDNDIMYHAAWVATAELRTINLATGASTLIGGLGGGAQTTCFAIPYTYGPGPEHDVGVKSINAPASGTAGVITPEVSVKNFGNYSEYDVPVNLEISKILPPTVIFSEEFEDVTLEGGPQFPPLGWSIQGISPSTWYKYSSGYARVIEDNTGAQDEWLITETFDCSALTGMSLRIGYRYMATPNDDYVEILGSTDNGSTWPNLITNITTGGSASNAIFDLSAWADGQSQVKIAWRWVSSAAMTGSDYFYMRDIDIYSDTITLFDNYWFNDIIPDDFGPNGWMQEDVLNMDSTPDPNLWRGADDTYSTTPTNVDPYAGDYMAIYNTGLLYPQGSMARLYTPPMDLSAAGATMLTLNFMLHMNNYGSSYTDHVDIEVSTDGSTWTALDSISTYDASNPGWTEIEIDLSSYASETTFRLGFLGVDGGYRDIIIDNVAILKPGMNLEYDQTVLVDVPIGETVDVTFPDWTPDDWQVAENVDIEYSCIATQLLADDDPGNDQKTKLATLNYPYLHDIAVISIDSPVTNGPGQTLPVQATIKNVGQFTECCYKTVTKIGSKVYTDAWQTIMWGGTRDWQIYDYGDHSYEPSACGTGDYYAGCYYTGGGTWDTSLVTYALDMTSAGSSATIELCEEFQDFAGYGQFGIYVHSGGVPDASGAGSSNYEETLYYMTVDEIPRYGIYRVFNINPSLYADPSQVYIEFWYTDDGYANAWGCGIDGLAIPEIGFYEDFEGSTFPPGSFIVIPEYDEEVCTIVMDPGEEATLTFPDWTPDNLGLGISGPIDYGLEAEQQLPGDTNPANDLVTAEVTLDYWHDVKIEDITSPAGDKRDMWDLQFQYDVGGLSGSLYLGGTEFDGTNFYCPEWNSPTIYVFDSAGSSAGTITIPGVSGLRDLAYDGTYMYGGDGTSNLIWEMDFTTQTLVSTIPSAVPSRSIAYDEDADAFWVNVWSGDVSLVDRTGAVIDTMPNPESLYGSAWDDDTEIAGYAGPFLWIFTGTSTGVDGIIKVVDIPTKALIPGVEHNVAQDLDPGIAGGLFTTTEYASGYLTIGGIIQGVGDDYLFGYELCTTGPPGAPTPDIFILPGTQSIAALVENAGTFLETGMNVNAQIYEFITNATAGTIVYDENYTCGTIDPLGGQETATFPDYTFPDIAGVYLLVITITPTDDMPDNNDMELGIGVDNVAPNSQHTIDPATPDGENGWYVSDVTVDFTADDGTEVWQSGVDHIEYRVNGGSWQTGNSVTVTTDREHTVQYKAIDEVGNEETANSVDFNIDQTIPNVDLIWESPDNVHVDFTAVCSDATSGMDYVEFYLNLGLMFTDNAAPFEWSIVWTPALKNEDFIAKAFDMAGNWDTDTETDIRAFPVPHSTPTPSVRQTSSL